jgi:hypothetical protein
MTYKGFEIIQRKNSLVVRKESSGATVLIGKEGFLNDREICRLVDREIQRMNNSQEY